MAKEVWQVDGLRVSIAKRLLILYFGQYENDQYPGYFFKIKLDQKMAEFKVWMIKKVSGENINKEDIEYFKEHFYGFNFILIDQEDCEML